MEQESVGMGSSGASVSRRFSTSGESRSRKLQTETVEVCLEERAYRFFGRL